MSVSVEFQQTFIELSLGEDCNSRELAAKIGIDANIMSKIMNYGIVPKPHVLVRIADYFDISVDYLLGRTKNEAFAKADEPGVSFYDRLDELRKEENLTYAKLGKRTSIDKSYFSNWKTKNYLPSLEYLTSLANYFKTSIDYLIGRTDVR